MLIWDPSLWISSNYFASLLTDERIIIWLNLDEKITSVLVMLYGHKARSFYSKLKSFVFYRIGFVLWKLNGDRITYFVVKLIWLL